MALKLMYITNDPAVAHIADKYSVDRIFIDMEVNGKKERQSNRDTVKSNHTLSDINTVKAALSTSQLLVRVNPLFAGSQKEIYEAIERGADILMLPMWRTCDEVKRFQDFVSNRAEVMLLLETRDAEKVLDEVLELPGIDEIHIGLNDLHIEYKLNFMFELLSNGTVERVMNKIIAKGKRCGFGGIARLNSGLISGKSIMAEHYRLGSEMAILSRSFCNTFLVRDLNVVDEVFKTGIKEIRDYECLLEKQNDHFFRENEIYVNSKISEIVSSIKNKRHVC
jgi:2-keto-3-deoxy-L-rhamnonate aldolase RhmA